MNKTKEDYKVENIKDNDLNKDKNDKDKDTRSRSKAIQDVIMNLRCCSKSCSTPAQRGDKNFPQWLQCNICNLWMHEHCISDSSRDESVSEISCKECKNNTDNKTLKVLNTKECKENMEVAAAKDKEIDKWTNYNVFDEIKEEENEEYLTTRWVITEKK